MLGLNGGLIGKPRALKAARAPGIWTPNEQNSALQARIWPPGIIYSNFLSPINASTGGAGSYLSGFTNPKNGFDGNSQTSVGWATGSFLRFSPPVPLRFDVSLQITGMEGTIESVLLNSTTSVNAVGGNVRFAGPGTITSLEMRDRPGSWFSGFFNCIILDGIVLSDPEFLML